MLYLPKRKAESSGGFIYSFANTTVELKLTIYFQVDLTSSGLSSQNQYTSSTSSSNQPTCSFIRTCTITQKPLEKRILPQIMIGNKQSLFTRLLDNQTSYQSSSRRAILKETSKLRSPEISSKVQMKNTRCNCRGTPSSSGIPKQRPKTW